MSNPNDAGGTADPRRFKLLPIENLNPEQRKLYDAIRSGPRAKLANSSASKPGPLGGPFNVWIRSPGIGDCVQRLGEEIRFRSSLPSKLNEMAIMITARFWTSQYEWFAPPLRTSAANSSLGMGPRCLTDKRVNRSGQRGTRECRPG